MSSSLHLRYNFIDSKSLFWTIVVILFNFFFLIKNIYCLQLVFDFNLQSCFPAPKNKKKCQKEKVEINHVFPVLKEKNHIIENYFFSFLIFLIFLNNFLETLFLFVVNHYE